MSIDECRIDALLVDKYQKCLKTGGEDKDRKEAGEQYLKAAEALKKKLSQLI